MNYNKHGNKQKERMKIVAQLSSWLQHLENSKNRKKQKLAEK